MIRQLGDIYASIFGRAWLAPFNMGLLYLGGRGLGLKNHATSRLSGEDYVLRAALPRHGAPVVFDVGANVGNWTRKVLSVNPAARMHLFEPQPRLAAALQGTFPKAAVSACGVGDNETTLVLHDYAEHEGSEHASLLEGVIQRVHGGESSETEVRVLRVDDYCRQHQIDRIDLMKVDVEGFEYKVLTGCGNLLHGGRIGAIQFEFNEMNVISRVFMSDFLDLLGPHYDLYRVLPNGRLPLVDRQRWINEQFTFQNVLALTRQP